MRNLNHTIDKNSYFWEIQAALDTVSNIKSEIELAKLVINVYSIVALFFAIVFLLFATYHAAFNSILLLTVLSALVFIELFVFNSIKYSYRKLQREKRAFLRILETAQEIAPFYCKHMSVLEKANIEAQLARLEIVGTANSHS